ncbi:pyridoxal-dependent decarboxylase [Aurantimonas sp. C2-6-R+9]|uniref:pyridoxal phosphate-dependent decarboxylase family protein n=1 Tax=unclassified Aurantimonas TaxID=2638230 RepID=UPI002E17965F|nr:MULTISPECIES: pyridoxal-dependent decarboxylase [unclassified Aurantimonas]MEC5293160.1 pyridoxal-dependent decarboxylase [Aurantimonas sp. C2-3-R2]MEC5383065.1 pyridoxal-dependent decarboxylase [Aurantimonas sp. C2-6-R+9]MEC5414239.1 pyridoxal-dependent decarboxylase [Aurantimonas sp. C2-4-R8]
MDTIAKEAKSAREETLDPADWEVLRVLARRVVDDAVDYIRDVRERPLWQDMPPEVRARFRSPVPQEGRPLAEVYDDLVTNMLPYPMGNIHPRFWMWYMGASNFTGALGDFLAAILGSNLGGGDHAAAEIDKQVVNWLKEMMGYPPEASGTLVSGGSMANLIGLTVARNRMSGIDLRELGVGALKEPMRFYGSDQIHSCHQIALEAMGMGNRALCRVPTDAACRMDVSALRTAIAEDRAAGAQPACVIATAGTVNTGAIDDLEAIADLCAEDGLWLHVDGCIGALLAIAPEGKALVRGIARADSIALDPHKWLHAPFEVGCALVRDADAHFGSFTLTPEYLENAPRGIASGAWLNDFGLQTSRGFRALKVWMALEEHGVAKFGRLIDQDLAHAHYLTERITATPDLSICFPTAINIVCFRYDPGGLPEPALKKLNTEIMVRMQEAGVAAVSDTTVQGRHCLRAAINNHRTTRADLNILIDEVGRQGAALIGEAVLERP